MEPSVSKQQTTCKISLYGNCNTKIEELTGKLSQWYCVYPSTIYKDPESNRNVNNIISHQNITRIKYVDHIISKNNPILAFQVTYCTNHNKFHASEQVQCIILRFIEMIVMKAEKRKIYRELKYCFVALGRTKFSLCTAPRF